MAVKLHDGMVMELTRKMWWWWRKVVLRGREVVEQGAVQRKKTA